MKAIPCAVSADLERFMASQEKQEAEKLAFEKRLGDMYLQTVSQTLDQILLASYESTRPAADKKAMHGVVNQLEELLEEAAHYMGQINE